MKTVFWFGHWMFKPFDWFLCPTNTDMSITELKLFDPITIQKFNPRMICLSHPSAWNISKRLLRVTFIYTWQLWCNSALYYRVCLILHKSTNFDFELDNDTCSYEVLFKFNTTLMTLSNNKVLKVCELYSVSPFNCLWVLYWCSLVTWIMYVFVSVYVTVHWEFGDWFIDSIVLYWMVFRFQCF